MYKVTAVVIAFAVCTALDAPGQVSDPAARAKAVGPFIDEQTIAVVRVDVTRIDIDALFAKLGQIVGQVEGDRDDKEAALEAIKRFDQPKQIVGKWVADFMKAGGRELYFVASLADIPRHPFFTIAPLQSRADARAIAGLICSGTPDGAVSATEPSAPT